MLNLRPSERIEEIENEIHPVNEKHICNLCNDSLRLRVMALERYIEELWEQENLL